MNYHFMHPSWTHWFQQTDSDSITDDNFVGGGRAFTSFCSKMESHHLIHCPSVLWNVKGVISEVTPWTLLFISCSIWLLCESDWKNLTACLDWEMRGQWTCLPVVGTGHLTSCISRKEVLGQPVYWRQLHSALQGPPHPASCGRFGPSPFFVGSSPEVLYLSYLQLNLPLCCFFPPGSSFEVPS